MSDHADTVTGIYRAIERRDPVPILELLAPDATIDVWDDNHAQRAGVPWLVERRGKAEIEEFFAFAEAEMDIRGFEVKSVMSGERKVAVEIVFEADDPPVRDEECHVWTFNEDGTIASLRHYLDTAKQIAAAGLA